MNALQSVTLLVAVLVGTSAIAAPPELPPVEITPAGDLPPVRSSKEREPEAQAPAPVPQPAPHRVQPVQAASSGAQAALSYCKARQVRTGRSIGSCLEIVDGDIKSTILNCGQIRKIESRGSAIVSAVVDSKYNELRLLGQSNLARSRRVTALLQNITASESLRDLMCSRDAFQLVLEGVAN
ncbi:MAG TPA: hypothetical protein VM432_04840 [Bdellovibrionales bacterium]|nr:hypothetical protein [Bdellovibrionales bacterium]